MTTDEFMSVLGGWKGYTLGSIERAKDAEGQDQILIELLAEGPRQCGGCGRRVSQVHERTTRWIRDLEILGMPVWLAVERCRVDCSRCGRKVEQVEWLDPYSRVTNRLARDVAYLCQHLPIKQVADFYGLSWSTVKAIDKAHLAEQLGPIDLDGVTLLAMDEFAIQKGHRYATVIVDPTRKRVLWVGRGRKRESLRPFFELLGERRRDIKAVVMDMNGAYEEEVRAQCPDAEIIYDLFHVVAKYGREVVDRVRVDEANRYRDDRQKRRLIKGSRWLLLRNKSNVAVNDRVRLHELLKANKRFLTVYVLKEDLKHLWNYRYPGAAKRFWDDWYHRAIRSRIEPLKKFARNLKRYLPGILAHCRWPLHTSLLEGINNKIKVIKRMAYGFRDDDYFFLKIRAAFPGIPR